MQSWLRFPSQADGSLRTPIEFYHQGLTQFRRTRIPSKKCLLVDRKVPHEQSLVQHKLEWYRQCQCPRLNLWAGTPKSVKSTVSWRFARRLTMTFSGLISKCLMC